MSRTTAAEIQENPAKKFLKWKTIKKTTIIDGEEVETMKGGAFEWYNKETEEKVDVKLPFKFAILNLDLTTFKGYDEKNKQGVWSNEVRDQNHVVNFRNKEGKILSFKLSEYKLNKDTLTARGGKYTKSVYIAVENEGNWEVQNIQLSGAALTGAINMEAKDPDEANDGWFSFTKNNKSKLYSNFVEVKTFKAKKKGTSKFTIPVYSLGEEIDEATSQKLNELDGQLTEFLDYYFAKSPVETEEKAEITAYSTDY